MTNIPTAIINVMRLLCINYVIGLLYIVSLEFLDKKVIGSYIEKGLEQIYYSGQDYGYSLSGLGMVIGYAIIMLTTYVYWLSYTTREHVRAYQAYGDTQWTNAYKRRERSMTKWAVSETRLRIKHITLAYLLVVGIFFSLATLFSSPFMLNTIFVMSVALSLFVLFCMFVYYISTFIACKSYIWLRWFYLKQG